jgi:hypothetical protein
MKNIVVIPMVIPDEKKLDKFGGWGWMEYAKTSWEYWCNKNGYKLVIYDSPSIEDTYSFRVTVQRFFDIFDFLKEKNIEYDQIAMIDACIIPRWDCPDFFKLTNNKFTAGLDNENLGWVYKSIKGYQHMFDGYELDINKYFCSGFIIFNKFHKHIFEKFKSKYLANSDEFIKLQTKTVKKGTCQTPLNYTVQMNNIEVNFLPPPYRVSHLYRKNLAMPFTYNNQLNEDKTLFFIKYCYIWQFSGFDKTIRNELMSEVWKLIKENYK